MHVSYMVEGFTCSLCTLNVEQKYMYKSVTLFCWMTEAWIVGPAFENVWKGIFSSWCKSPLFFFHEFFLWRPTDMCNHVIDLKEREVKCKWRWEIACDLSTVSQSRFVQAQCCWKNFEVDFWQFINTASTTLIFTGTCTSVRHDQDLVPAACTLSAFCTGTHPLHPHV